MKKNKKINNVWRVLGLLALPVIMCSCSLAVENAGTEGSGDRMIGAFITSEYLDLFDMDAWLDDNTSKLGNGKNIQVTDTSGYEQKLYAEIDKNNSENPEKWDVVFPGIEGINFFTPVWTDENGETYRGGVYGDGICDTNISINESDTEKALSLSGTICVLPGGTDENISYYVNPVYQTENGEIYTVSSSGMSTSGAFSEGTKMTMTLNAREEITENADTYVEAFNVDVSIVVMSRPVKFTVCQMDKEHQILKQTEYAPGELPEEVVTEPETAYIILETEKETVSGEQKVTRELWEQEAEQETYMRSFVATEDGVLVGHDTAVVWTE